jgi:hypothetical protein
VLTAKSAICATEPGNNTNSRRCSSHDSGYGLRAVFLVSGIVIKGAVSSHVSPSSSRHDRAARFKMHRTTSSARLIVVSLTPSRRRWALKGSSVASWICRSVRLPMNGNSAEM